MDEMTKAPELPPEPPPSRVIPVRRRSARPHQAASTAMVAEGPPPTPSMMDAEGVGGGVRRHEEHDQPQRDLALSPERRSIAGPGLFCRVLLLLVAGAGLGLQRNDGLLPVLVRAGPLLVLLLLRRIENGRELRRLLDLKLVALHGVADRLGARGD